MTGVPLLDALAEHARSAPDRSALHDGAEWIGYGALHRRVERVAAGLAAQGVGAGQRVAVLGHKTVDAVVALLAVLRAGAAYVPLDPQAPPQRAAQLLGDAGCPVAIVGPRDTASSAVLSLTVEQLAVGEQAALPSAIDSDAVAYCMYTSGSTGSPKGVQITHRAITAFFGAVHPLLGADRDSRCLNTSALHFDVSVVDLLYPLWCGASVQLGPPVPVPLVLVGLIERERITHMAAVGSTLTLLADSTDGFRQRNIGSLRRVMTGAEVIDPQTVQRWLAAAPELTVINGYGPTEATCLVLAHCIAAREPDRTAPYPIGRPLAGITLRFLSDDGEPSETGPGEIVVGGEQVMTGYLGRPEEQRRAFVELEGVRFYRTGDRGELQPDGSVLFHGRRDDEIKFRGYRINLQEIQRTAEEFPLVGRAFVGAAEDARGRRILACAVAPPGATAAHPPTDRPDLAPLPSEQADRLRHHLAALLPRYMVPESYWLLPRVPMLSSGKPDSAGIQRMLQAAGADGVAA
ncbi:MAG: amino acid adenylation domain-containing protein [Actinomadura sp.]